MCVCEKREMISPETPFIREIAGKQHHSIFNVPEDLMCTEECLL